MGNDLEDVRVDLQSLSDSHSEPTCQTQGVKHVTLLKVKSYYFSVRCHAWEHHTAITSIRALASQFSQVIHVLVQW